MHFWTDYGLFLAKITTAIIATFILLTGIITIARKGKAAGKDKLSIKKLNTKYEELADTLNAEILDKKARKKLAKQQKLEKKAAVKVVDNKVAKRRIFVIHFQGDMKASAVNSLREEITAILTVATPKDEVVVCLESAGGMVAPYGLAASQLERLKKKNIPLTVTVDKIAASGGYMMACVADRILAAPFAIIGSIGVVAQIPNFHRLLKKNDIDFELLTAGEYKRTLTIFGENTEKGKLKFQEDLEEIHQLFKNFIRHNRPVVDIQQVATGEHWLAKRAQELNLVDDLITSDDYLLSASQQADIYEVKYAARKTLSEKLTSAVYATFDWFNARGI